MTPETGHHQAILNRLERLEKDNRRLRFVGAAVLILSAGFVFMGQVSLRHDTIEAREIVLRDDAGTVRIRLAATKKGPMFGMFDEQKRPRVGIGAFGDATANLTLFDGHGRPRIGLGSGTESEAGILILDEKGSTAFSKP